MDCWTFSDPRQWFLIWLSQQVSLLFSMLFIEACLTLRFQGFFCNRTSPSYSVGTRLWLWLTSIHLIFAAAPAGGAGGGASTLHSIRRRRSLHSVEGGQESNVVRVCACGFQEAGPQLNSKSQNVSSRWLKRERLCSSRCWSESNSMGGRVENPIVNQNHWTYSTGFFCGANLLLQCQKRVQVLRTPCCEVHRTN